MKTFTIISVSSIIFVVAFTHAGVKPNIVFILMDDLGYGDVQAFNPDAKTTTPNIDKLAESGMKFTDAHSPWATCIASRYGLLTGRFEFRNTIWKEWRERPVINSSRLTMAGVLQQNGYATGMVGKWHLGFDYSNYNNLTGGPVDRGFDYYFGISRSLDQQDYYYIEDRSATRPPDVDEPGSPGYGYNNVQGRFWRAGLRGSDFVFEDVLYKFKDKAITYMQEQAADTSRPFLLYLAFGSPHTPWLPAGDFVGSSGLDEFGKVYGEYGDFVNENDFVVGQVLDKIAELGISDETLIFFTSDNGPVWTNSDRNVTGHSAAGIYRDQKGSAYEGGHRVPFIVSYPGVVEANTTSTQLINFTDILATFAAVAGVALPDNQAQDSYNLWPAILNANLSSDVRNGAAIVGHTQYIRQGDWKLKDENELYNLADDPGETDNQFNSNRNIASDLEDLLQQYKDEGRSTPVDRPAEVVVFGCMDSTASNYDATAVAEPANSCIPATGIQSLNRRYGHRINISPTGFTVTGAGAFELTVHDVSGQKLFADRNTGKNKYPRSVISTRGIAIIRVKSFEKVTARIFY